MVDQSVDMANRSGKSGVTTGCRLQMSNQFRNDDRVRHVH